MTTKRIRPEQVLYSGAITILEHKASYTESKLITEEYGGRLATLKDMIIQLGADSTFSDRVNGQGFWLGDNPGLKVKGWCRINYLEGALEPVSREEWEELTPKDRAYSPGGLGPVALGFSYKDGDRCLSVFADIPGGFLATRIAIVKDKQDSAEPKMLLRKG